MRWLLYQRLADGRWVPHTGGPWLWVGLWSALFLGSLCLVAFSITRIRRGRPGLWRVLGWVTAMWVLAVADMGMNSLAGSSKEWQVVRRAWTLLGGAWAMYGVLVILPLLFRESRAVKEERPTQKGGLVQPLEAE